MPTNSYFEGRVKQIACEITQETIPCITPSAILPETTFQGDLGLSDKDVQTLLTRVEKMSISTFGVDMHIPASEVHASFTVGDVLEIFEQASENQIH